MRTFKNLFLFYGAVIVAACNDLDRRPEKSVPGTIFCDYKISGEEESEDVSCLLQFKLGGPNGNTVLLKEPGKIALDGKDLEADSAGLSGVIYETTRPAIGFRGKHTIVFTDPEQNLHETEFEFIPFSLVAEIAEKVERKPFTIKLKDFPLKETPVRLMLIDTAFLTNDVNEIIRVKDSKLTISEAMLHKLKAGPISIELVKEEENPIGKGADERGRILISYGLRRVFQLVN